MGIPSKEVELARHFARNSVERMVREALNAARSEVHADLIATLKYEQGRIEKIVDELCNALHAFSDK